jgi:hypothetical protein
LEIRVTRLWEVTLQKEKYGVHVEFSVRCPSPLNTSSYVQEENSGSTRKLVENYLLFWGVTNLILALHTQSMDGLVRLF